MANQNKNRKRTAKSKSSTQTLSRDDMFQGSPNKSKRNNKNSGATKQMSDPYNNNDISWYTPTAQMLTDCATLSFSEQLANGVNLSMYDNEIISYKLNTPGVMSIELVPSLGVVYDTDATPDGTDSINIAAQSIYSYIRNTNSGAKNYEGSDLMMYLLAMDSIYMAWSYLVRLYGVARTYNFYNQYAPTVFLRAMGIEHPETVPQLLNDLRAYINVKAIQLSTRAVPRVMPYFERHLWLYQNIFSDSDSNKSQTYIFNPAVLYKWNETDNPNSLLPYVKPEFSGSNGALLMKQIADWFDGLWSAVYTNESIGVISGDILKAYGANNIYGFEQIPETYTVVPVYKDLILPQIHNTTILPYVPSDITAIKQDPIKHWIYQSMPITKRVPVTGLLNVRRGETDPTGVMYATRLMGVASNDRSRLYTGSEYCIAAGIYTGTGSSDYTEITESVRTINLGTTTDNAKTALTSELKKATALSKFDWAPHYTPIIYNANVVENVFNFTDLDEFTTMAPMTLKKIHACALAGEFGIPDTISGL